MDYAVEISNLTVYYGKICALSNINMAVKKGEFLGIIGPNGGGKSTLLKTIAGLVRPVQGTVKVFGQAPDITGCPIGWVPQHNRFDKQYPASVSEIVMMGRLPAKTKLFYRYSGMDKEIVNLLMKKLDIYDLKDRQIGELSGGQMQRVLIARALAVQPKILLLDEPTVSLDTNSRMQIYEILKVLNQDITIIVVTHETGIISSYIKNIACLNGELFYHGVPELNNAIIKKVYGCPIDLITHGTVPHRVLNEHEIHKKEIDN